MLVHMSEWFAQVCLRPGVVCCAAWHHGCRRPEVDAHCAEFLAVACVDFKMCFCSALKANEGIAAWMQCLLLSREHSEIVSGPKLIRTMQRSSQWHALILSTVPVRRPRQSDVIFSWMCCLLVVQGTKRDTVRRWSAAWSATTGVRGARARLQNPGAIQAQTRRSLAVSRPQAGAVGPPARDGAPTWCGYGAWCGSGAWSGSGAWFGQFARSGSSAWSGTSGGF